MEEKKNILEVKDNYLELAKDNLRNMDSANIQIEQREGIKLTKNAKGDYQWEIKILSLDVDKLEELNNKMNNKFKSKE